MKKAKISILMLWIVVIETLAEDIVQLRSHKDIYDIITIYKIHSKNTAENGCEHKNFKNSTCNYYVEIHLKTNAIGMPITDHNGFILKSNTKSLEFIADSKYLTNIQTRNDIEYDANEWKITTLSMWDGRKIPKLSSYNLLLWKANNIEESFKINWKQKNSVQMCISISYYKLENNSQCRFIMDLINKNNSNTEQSYEFQQAEELKTMILKSSKLLLKNTIYSLNFKLVRIGEEKLLNNYYGSYYKTRKEYAKCQIGIKRIAQCLDEFENEDLYSMITEEYQYNSRVTPNFKTFNIYPFEHLNSDLSTISISPSILSCLNGGFTNENKCLCPPGFKGDSCEHACGSNTFGADCSGMCSMYQTRCQKMVFCTNSFGCTCPTGYYGNDCETECSSGTYGVDCKQTCSSKCNLGTCDIYTGHCTEGCKKNYISPKCEEKYPWLINPPQLESLDFRSLKLKLNFSLDNIHGSKKINSVYYQIIYKPVLYESEYQYMEFKEINGQESVTEIIDDLKPGTTYSFGVVLVSENGNYNNDDIVMVNYSTLCQSSRSINYDIKLLGGTDYFNVTWNKLNNQNEDECKITEYLLKLMFNNTNVQQSSYSEEYKSNYNEYKFENLIPGQKYAVEVTAISTTGQKYQTSKTSYFSTEVYGFVQIQNIRGEFINNNRSLLITWDNNDKIPMAYIVKYKVYKCFSCSNNAITREWTLLTVYNQTKCEILNITPNSQYILQVMPIIKGHTYNDHENSIFVKTPMSVSTLIPIYDENNSYITNQTAYFNWTINTNECSKLNGFFLGYHVILKNIIDGTQLVNTTKYSTINYDGLVPDTKYELQVYVRTNYGFNSEKVLLIPFKTKSKFLVAVDELVVYKKNLRRKSIGIRWSFPDEFIVNGFIIMAIDNNINSAKQIVVEPEKCIAWPTLYCATIENLIPNNQYTIKIKAKSLDYPSGGCTASIVSNFNEGFSDKPGNLKAKQVGFEDITLEWDIPWIFNGVLKSFIVNIEEISFKDNDTCCDSIPDVEIQIAEEMPTYNYTIHNLKPGSTYSIGVLSRTASYGQTNRIYVTTISSTNSTIKPEEINITTTDNNNNYD